MPPRRSIERARTAARATRDAAGTIAAMRLAAQCVSSTRLTRPEQVVARLGAVQAQDYLGALWAVGLRLTGASDATERDVERAIEQRRIVRTWPMRGTLHFVAAADARWISELLAPRALAAAAGRLRALGLDEPTVLRARRTLVRALEGDRRLTRPGAYEVLERAKIATGGQRGLHLLWRLAHDGVLCFGPRAGKQPTFVLLDEWLPAASRRSRDEALGELATRYFTGHGPATVADLAWWSGLKISDARAAIALAGRRLVAETFGAQTFHLAAAASSATLAEPTARATLLPAFDELLVAYVDRSAALADAHRLRVNAGGGILHPTILVDGRVVGTWKRQLGAREVVFAPAPFAPLSPADRAAVAEAFRRYARFVGLEPAASER